MVHHADSASYGQVADDVAFLMDTQNYDQTDEIAQTLLNQVWIGNDRELIVRSQEGQPVVHAILFWMNGCPHCHKVIESVLPPLQEKYGDKLDVLMIEVVTVDDINHLLEVGEAYGIPKNAIGVPLLVVGDDILLGDVQIPEKFPVLVDQYLAKGGVDFPDKPEIAPFLPEEEEGEEEEKPTQLENGPTEVDTASTVTKTESSRYIPVISTNESKNATPPPPKAKGFNLAIAIMIGMVVAIIYSGVTFVRGGDKSDFEKAYKWVNPITLALLVIGFVVAGYLSYVEIFEVTAVCGPVGDCNAVQSSPYAKLFGLIPIGVIGMGGYVGMFIALMLRKSNNETVVEYANMALFGMSIFGTFFSLYLTYLEPFVIHAVCAWCLTSTVIVTLIMVINAKFAAIGIDDFDDEAELEEST